MIKLPDYQKSSIKMWADGYCSETLNFEDAYMICEWCRKYNKYSPAKDTNNPLERFNVGVYQLAYIETLMTEFDVYEWGESIGSVFIHMVASFECCGIDCGEILSTAFFSNEYKAPKREGMEQRYIRILKCIPKITRQIYYKAWQRDNRYDEEILKEEASNIIRNLMYLNYASKERLYFPDSLYLAIAKLTHVELNFH